MVHDSISLTPSLTHSFRTVGHIADDHTIGGATRLSTSIQWPVSHHTSRIMWVLSSSAIIEVTGGDDGPTVLAVTLVYGVGST